MTDIKKGRPFQNPERRTRPKKQRVSITLLPDTIEAVRDMSEYGDSVSEGIENAVKRLTPKTKAKK